MELFWLCDVSSERSLSAISIGWHGPFMLSTTVPYMLYIPYHEWFAKAYSLMAHGMHMDFALHRLKSCEEIKNNERWENVDGRKACRTPTHTYTHYMRIDGTPNTMWANGVRRVRYVCAQRWHANTLLLFEFSTFFFFTRSMLCRFSLASRRWSFRLINWHYISANKTFLENALNYSDSPVRIRQWYTPYAFIRKR